MWAGGSTIDGEGRHDREKPAQAAARQQQPDDEEDVVRADRDVMDARGDEAAEHGEPPLSGAGVVIGPDAVLVEDVLPDDGLAFVDGDECLVRRVLREHTGANPEVAGRSRQTSAPGDDHGVLPRHGLDAVDRPRDRRGVGLDGDPGCHQRRNRLGAVVDDVRALERAGIGDAQDTRHVEIVQHQRAREAVGADADVQIAEGSRMRLHRDRRQQPAQ